VQRWDLKQGKIHFLSAAYHRAQDGVEVLKDGLGFLLFHDEDCALMNDLIDETFPTSVTHLKVEERGC
jgi:hypothetical protein